MSDLDRPIVQTIDYAGRLISIVVNAGSLIGAHQRVNPADLAGGVESGIEGAVYYGTSLVL
jgi:hypothetical protein